MIERIDEIKKAKAQVVDGALTIWNARLEALVCAGNIIGALDQLNRAVEAGDNCGCNSACGAGFPVHEFVREISGLKS